ncbi:cystatin [Antennarius striatus]|uniref:cystatin n=1 Tax=Antennarius striatus TaxID=241820 RepID=UPI0035B44894
MMGNRRLLLVCLLIALEATSLAGHLIGSQNDLDKNDDGFVKLVSFAECVYNRISNDLFFSKILSNADATKQVVEGLLFRCDFEMSRTVCRKKDHVGNLRDCELQPEGPLRQTFKCHIEVWERLWLQDTRIQNFHCQDEINPDDKESFPDGAAPSSCRFLR